MNRILQFSIFIFWGTLLYAQDVVLDGVTFSADGKTLIKYQESKVDKEYVVPEGTEIIDVKAFNQSEFLCHVILPSTLKEIRDNAFFYCSSLVFVTWSNFPLLIGRDIFYESPIREFYVSDGANCVVVNNVLFSMDQKRLLRYPPKRKKSQEESQNTTYFTEYVIPEGTEIINRLAFERAFLHEVTLPSTLKMVEEGAFWVKARIPVGRNNQETNRNNDFDWDLEYRNMDLVVCNAIVPPVLIGNPFANPYWTRLHVPEESFDAYCYAPGWTKFRDINNKPNPSSVNEISLSGLRTFLDGDDLNIMGTRKISEVRLYALNGILLLDKSINDNSCNFKINNLLHGLLLLEVVYEDGTREKIKLHK
ncbi:leucine-rich repeat protein [Bacteroides nordii]|uniref:Leucine-rich repeat domain-containing protein n=1 Tax=Bacteroides nordii TaxID=291645 RepID=A0A413VPU7_9BACE|nr:leucine-rich repeat protein [Bacteroides nordii]RHB35569.1 hypothetical protein DW888_10500 [Bacteroides nordii]